MASAPRSALAVRRARAAQLAQQAQQAQPTGESFPSSSESSFESNQIAGSPRRLGSFDVDASSSAHIVHPAQSIPKQTNVPSAKDTPKRTEDASGLVRGSSRCTSLPLPNVTASENESLTPPDCSNADLTTSKRIYTPHVSEARCIRQNGTIICGLREECIVMRGICILTVLRGAIRIAGARLTRRSHPFPIYAPDTFPAAELVLEPSPTHEDHCDLFPDCDTVVRLESMRCGLEQLSRVCPIAGMDPFSMHRALPGCTFTLLSDASDVLCMPNEWLDTLDELASLPSRVPGIVAVRGLKNSGKSTYARMLLHAFLTGGEHRFVAYMELDVGQPEFGPPGMLCLHVFDSQREHGLFAPGWCTARMPVRAHFLGDITPRDDPARYMAAVSDLVDTYRSQYQFYQSAQRVEEQLYVPATSEGTLRADRTIPLIVNTHGWLKGLGLELVQHVTATLMPTHVLDIGPTPCPDATHTLVPFPETLDGRASVPQRRLNAAESRTLSLLTYMHMTRLASPGVRAQWNFASALVAQRPWVVDVSSGLGAGFAALDTGAHVDEALTLLAMNGALVAIVQAPEHVADGETKVPDVWRTAIQRGRDLLTRTTPPMAPTLGLALVRSINMEQEQMHLLTPISGPDLHQRIYKTGLPIGLLQGALDLPFWGALDAETYADVMQWRRGGQPSTHLAGVPCADVPYLLWPSEFLARATHCEDDAALSPSGSSAEPLGARPRKVRRNLMRRRHKSTALI